MIEERDPNGELEYLLRLYQKTHPEGKAMDATASEHDAIIGANRRRVDRAIWCGLGRLPKRKEVPTICVEFVSVGRRSHDRDYRGKRSEYKLLGFESIGSSIVLLASSWSFALIVTMRK